MIFLKRHWQEILLFAAIVSLAGFLRLYRLDQLPPGLHYDEAFKGVEAGKVIAGPERPIFFTENLTEEPMMVYASALSFILFGDTPWAIRLVSAVAGIITVAALYFLARSLFKSRWLAALAAFILAILYWHINFSRLGMEPILTPMTMTLSFAFLWYGINDDRRRPTTVGGRRSAVGWGDIPFILAGIFMGLTQYTYKAALFVPILVGGFFVVELLVDRTFWARYGRGLIIFALVAVLVFAPLGLYFVTHPGEFLERPSTVSVASSGSGTLIENAIKVAGMFFLRGDDNPRSNLPDRPVLDPFLAIGFVAGLIVCLFQLRRTESRFILIWFGVMSIPSIITDFAPHFGRSIGLPPVIALLTAFGFATIVEKALDTKSRPVWLLPTVYCLLFAGLAFSTCSSVRDYFQVWGERTGLFDSFDVGYLSLAEKLHDRPANESLYLSPLDRNYYTVQFGLNGRDARSFDGRQVLVLAPAGSPATYGIVTREDASSLARLAKFFPNGKTIETIFDTTGKPYAALYRVDGAPMVAPQQSVRAQLGDSMQLIGYDWERQNAVIALTVYWGSIAETRIDYTVFVHLIGAMNPATQSPVWAQDDARPGRGSFPTTRWQAGEVVVDEYRLELPANLPPGEYQIEIGMYNLETGARVRVTDANGAPMENDSVLFQRIALP